MKGNLAEVAAKYHIQDNTKYEPVFQYGREVKGTGVILEASSAAQFAEYFERSQPKGKLILKEVKK